MYNRWIIGVHLDAAYFTNSQPGHLEVQYAGNDSQSEHETMNTDRYNLSGKPRTPLSGAGGLSQELRRILLIIAHSCLLFVMAGCNESYRQSSSRLSPAAGVSELFRWHASGTVTAPGRAIDGNLSTAASAGPGVIDPTIQIDLGSLCHFNMIVIEHGGDSRGYAKAVWVLTSCDGVEFKAIYKAAGTRGRTCLLLGGSQLARYVRLQGVLEDGRRWSIGEVVIQ